MRDQSQYVVKVAAGAALDLGERFGGARWGSAHDPSGEAQGARGFRSTPRLVEVAHAVARQPINKALYHASQSRQRTPEDTVGRVGHVALGVVPS
jgi:hypothetical protein